MPASAKRKVAAVNDLRVFTIGHSNHPIEVFLSLLRLHAIAVVADVRSHPYCRYSTQFCKEDLQRALESQGVRYRFMGDTLGGQPGDEDFYDDTGRVYYDRLADSPGFKSGIAELLGEIGSANVVLLCGEEDPRACHRRNLIARVLSEKEGVTVVHLRGDGRAQSEEDVRAEETGGQLDLLEGLEAGEWKSTQSVSPKKTPASSSKP
jgi:uncharacterized protein (DUF488 family)